MVFSTPIFTSKRRRNYTYRRTDFRRSCIWQCVPTARFLFMNLFLNRNVFTCRQKKEPVLKKQDNDEVAEEEHDLPGATSRTLEEALEQAIKDENYELAAQDTRSNQFKK